MYSVRVERPHVGNVVIDRRMSSNTCKELMPTVIEICKAEYAMVNPSALYMGNNVWRVFDIHNPWLYAKVTIVCEGAK